MNPFAELHARLVHLAVSGTALLEEDFRLRKLLDAFAPLAHKNPVFGKIHAGLAALFDAPPEQRGMLLLGLLGLVDAVIYTQAESGVDGELVSLPENEVPGEMQHIPYSEMFPLIKALTTKGAGREAAIMDMLAVYPKRLADPRILQMLIQDLGDTYTEVAALIFELLKSLGRGDRFFKSRMVCSGAEPARFPLPKVDSAQLVSQLRRGFDAMGKKDMAKRVLLVSMISQEKENDWYLSLAQTGSKEVKAQAMLALRYLKENIPVLLELAQTERGEPREMAYCALGRMDAPELDAFWKKNLPKSKKFAEYVTYVKSDGVADIVARQIRKAVEAVIAEARLFPHTEEVAHWCNALPNKCSDGVFELYRWLFGEETDIHHITKEVFYSLEFERERIENKICQTLVLTNPQRLVDFLTAFSETHPGKMERACFVSDLLHLPASQVYDKWAHSTSKMLYKCFAHVVYQDGTYSLDIYIPEDMPYTVRTLKEPLDPRWFAHMVQNDCLDLLERLLPLEDASVCQRVGTLCHEAYCNQDTAHKIQAAPGQVANCVDQTLRYLHIFEKCQLPNPQGLILVLCRRQPQISIGYLQPVFAAYQDYAGAEATNQEARRVLQFYEETNYKSASMIEKMRDMMRMYGFLTEQKEENEEVR